jgi:hypothetical protein
VDLVAAVHSPVSGTEHPLYVGKADPALRGAAGPKQQGTRLYGRLVNDHRRNIEKATGNLRIKDFDCRYLVVRTGWQIPAEDYLIHLFQPVWNKETGILLGLGKHGDKAETRGNTRSPWDTLHPGRSWATTRDRTTKADIIAKLKQHFRNHPPLRTLDEIVLRFMEAARQV